MYKNIETYDSDLTLIKESASELQNITHSIAVKYDDLIKVLEGYEYDVLEDHEYVKENIKAIDSLAKEMLQNTAVLYSTLNDCLHEIHTNILNSEKSSLGEFLEDDPEGFMDDWDEYKRTPVIPIDKDVFENCKTCEHAPEECDKCYPELGYKNTKLERDTKAVTDNAEELASLAKSHERKRKKI